MCHVSLASPFLKNQVAETGQAVFLCVHSLLHLGLRGRQIFNIQFNFWLDFSSNESMSRRTQCNKHRVSVGFLGFSLWACVFFTSHSLLPTHSSLFESRPVSRGVCCIPLASQHALNHAATRGVELLRGEVGCHWAVPLQVFARNHPKCN